MSMNPDVYVALTPFGIVEADFPEEGGVVWSGPAEAIEHIRDVMGRCTNGRGITMTDTNLEPADFENFCQPAWSGIKIVPPPDAQD